MRSELAPAIAHAALQAALDASPSPAAVLGPRGRVLRVNAAARALLDEGGRAMVARLRRATIRVPIAVRGRAEWALVLLPPAPGAPAEAAAARRWGLTPRERGVLSHLARGAGNATIAAALGVTARTVAAAVSSILRKSGARDRAQLVVRVASGT